MGRKAVENKKRNWTFCISDDEKGKLESMGDGSRTKGLRNLINLMEGLFNEGRFNAEDVAKYSGHMGTPE